MKLILHSYAKAFAIIVFPVPLGPNNKNPFLCLHPMSIYYY